MATFEQCQAEHDAQTPQESLYQLYHENLDLQFDEAEEKLKFLFRGIATYERHVPNECQDRTAIRIRLNALCELTEDTLAEFGGRITYSRKQSG